MASTPLPAGMLLNNVNFIPWKARMNAALKALSLPSSEDEKPATTSQEEWTACSGLAACIIHNFVPTHLLEQVRLINQHDHAKLMANLEDMTLRFRFMELPPELRNVVYSFLIPDRAPVLWSPLRKSRSSSPSITSVARQIRSESLPIFYARSLFVLDFRSPETSPEDDSPSAKRANNVPALARMWAQTLYGPCKKHLREIMVLLQVQSDADGAKSELRALGFAHSSGRGLAGRYYIPEEETESFGELFDKKSRRLLKRFARRMDKKRAILHLQGESLIMAITEDDPIWKYGTLHS